MRNKVIVDIDGTIANVDHRLHLIDKSNGVDKTDWDEFYSLCESDKPIQPIIDLVRHFAYDLGKDVIFLTGRRAAVRKKTILWLEDHVCGYLANESLLLMRPAGELRHDIHVKPENLARVGIGPEDVAYILEDRNSMVKKWRELGYTCLQVAEGDF